MMANYCSDVRGDWDDHDAKVVCRMLGLDTAHAKATSRSKYGDLIMDDFARERYLPMDYIKCTGQTCKRCLTVLTLLH